MRVSQEGPAAPDEVWRRYTSPAAWPGWAPQITRVACTDDPIAPGARGVVHGPALLRVPFRILDVDTAARTWSWRVGIGPAGIRMEHGVDETPAGARAWVRIHVPTLLALPYAPVARLALRRLVAAG